jgi:hypothetical protein
MPQAHRRPIKSNPKRISPSPITASGRGVFRDGKPNGVIAMASAQMIVSEVLGRFPRTRLGKIARKSARHTTRS